MHRYIRRQSSNRSIENLVDPKRARNNDKEQRKLNDNRLNENDIIDPIDCQRRADAFERLPSEELKVMK